MVGGAFLTSELRSSGSKENVNYRVCNGGTQGMMRMTYFFLVTMIRIFLPFSLGMSDVCPSEDYVF